MIKNMYNVLKWKRIAKATALSFLLFHLSFSPAAAQKLSINKTTIDVGKTGFEVPVTATFELRNKSLKTIEISELKTDCGCTTVDAPKQTIAPGERFTISLTYDARLLGHFTKQVAVYSNATREPVYLKMKGVVLADMVDYSNRYPYDMGGMLASVNNVEFDDVKKGENREVEINLMNNTEADMTPNMLHMPSWLHALALPEKLEPNRSGKMILTLNSEEVHNYGLTQVSIYLAKKLGEKISSETEIPVSVVLLPDMSQFEGQNREQAPKLHLSAQSLNLDRHHKQGTIILTNKGQSKLCITSLQMFTGGVKVKLAKQELQPGESTKLRVTIIPEQIRKARSKPRVLMITNDPENAKVVITINVE
ncbi:MAG: DUF1573 domain-containing protein [Prevotella sp.]|nr:DUF1573 domain-containing protein [Prevotella sp.]